MCQTYVCYNAHNNRRYNVNGVMTGIPIKIKKNTKNERGT